MNIHKKPDIFEKIGVMGETMQFEPAGDSPHAERHGQRFQSRSLAECISHVQTPRGAKPVLKSMMTTACEKNCFYCPFRAGRSKTKRVTFTPDEMAKAFNVLEQGKQADGLFLSSGIIKGGVTAQDKIIETAEIVRRRYRYRGYVHLKLMPASEYDQIARAVQLADRVSINLEAPTQERLNALAPKKDFNGDLLQRLLWASELTQREYQRTRRRVSVVTQFVVGAVGDTDLEHLSLTAHLYKQAHLARTYFSAFHPISQTPFEGLPAENATRELRLYQASFLLRDYGWDTEELGFMTNGNLPLSVDPKQAWADLHLRVNPIDVMHATREQLMRVPSIGVKGADLIVKARQRGGLRDCSDLRAIGVAGPERALPYILFNGKKPPLQKTLWD